MPYEECKMRKKAIDKIRGGMCLKRLPLEHRFLELKPRGVSFMEGIGVCTVNLVVLRGNS